MKPSRPALLFATLIPLALAGCAGDFGEHGSEPDAGFDDEELGQLHAQVTPTCVNPADDPTGYTAYPDGVPTVLAYPSTYPWKETFESYPDNATIECASNKNARSHLDVTANCLYASTSSSGVKRAFTTADVFRVVGRRTASGRLVRYSNISVQNDFRIADFDNPSCGGSWGCLAKISLFARYTDPENLYVATIANNGRVKIQSKKSPGCYQKVYDSGDPNLGGKLPGGDYSPLQTHRTYRLRFEVSKQTHQLLRLYRNGVLVGEAVVGPPAAGEPDWRHHSGTHGIRTDYLDVNFDNWRISNPPGTP